MRRPTKIISFLAAIILATPLVHAEDTDIFSGVGGSGGAPNVLFVVDSRASNDATVSPYTCSYAPLSNGTMLDMLQCGLMMSINNINAQPSLSGKLSVAIMVAHPRWFYPDTWPPYFTLMNSAGVATIAASLQTDPKAKDGIKERGNGSLGEEMWEAWAFLSGKGHQGPLQKPYTTSQFGTVSCQKTFIIMIGNVDGKHANPSNSAGGNVADLQNAADPAATAAQLAKINTKPSIGPDNGEDASSIDEWARYLHQTNFSGDPDDPQGATTYTIGTYGINGLWADKVQELKSAAIQGGGKSFFVNDLGTLTNVLGQIFNEIAATNTAFASSSLPVSANAQGTFSNQIFMGQFRPDASGGPRWAGNLKQYQFGVSGTAPNQTLFLADAKGVAAISGAGTGFISANAESFWTKKTTAPPDDTGGFWVNAPEGVAQGYDLPDGEFVYKGGVAQQLRLANLKDDYVTNPHSPRNVYTCVGTCANGNSLSGFNFASDNSTITAALLGVSAPTTTLLSLTRSGTTVTAVLSTAPSVALTNGQTVTIQGSANQELNGNFSIALVNSTTFTYAISESPPTPSTGTYTASLPSNPNTISSLTRAGTTVTATSNGHGYANGENVTISGATGAEYNGTFTISGVTTNTFQYTIVDGPVMATTGGTADIGATHTNGISFTAADITRDTTHADNTSQVTIFKNSLPSTYVAAAKVNVFGVTPSGYNVTLATIIQGAANGSCGHNGSSGKNYFCFSIPTTPVTPDTGASKKSDRTGSVSITGLSHPAACTGASPVATVTVTATTSANHGFVTGDVVSIAGSPVGGNESAYVGNFTITKVDNTHFTYTATTTPPCSPSVAGVTAITNSGGVDKDSLINWVRGADNVFDEPSPGNGITIRPSVHGDLLHSRPTVVNYGSSTGVVVFYGANDGTFRAINGNQPLGSGNPIGGAAPGGEIWSFIPTEFYKKLKRLYLNSPQIKLANTPTGITPTPLPRDYFFDGSTGVYQSGSTVYIFLAGRRGVNENGKGVIYALDVSTPSDPKFLWKHVGGESGFEELGQAWSTPKVALVKGYNDGGTPPVPKPVLIFGGGYDTNQDSDPPGVSNDSTGRAIFVLDAATGAIVWKAAFSGTGTAGACTTVGTTCSLSDMTYSIPADITLLNRDYDLTNYIDRLYAADIGGNIWRVDLEPTAGTAPSNWKVTRFASLGGSGSPKRKFFFPPDVVTTKNFDMVMAGTGDREHPLYSASVASSYAVHNRFYGLKDPNIGNNVAAGWTAILDDTASTGTAVPTAGLGLTKVVPPTTLYDPATVNNGFYIDMPNNGEKIVNAATTVGGFSYFGTNTPPLPTSQACTNEGTARGYQVNFLTGATNSNVLDSKGLPPSPVAGLVSIHMADGSDQTFPFLLGANPDPGCHGPDCTSGFGGTRPPVPIPPTRKRVYWFVDGHD